MFDPAAPDTDTTILGVIEELAEPRGEGIQGKAASLARPRGGKSVRGQGGIVSGRMNVCFNPKIAMAAGISECRRAW